MRRGYCHKTGRFLRQGVFLTAMIVVLLASVGCTDLPFELPTLPNPLAPVAPTDPSKPANPTDPSKPANPAKPANPVNPANPANPPDPANPVNPANPANPPDPANPVNPTDPAMPADSDKPTPLPPFPPEEAEIGAVVKTFVEVQAPEAPTALKYDRYRMTYTYFLVQRQIKLFSQPSEQAQAAGMLYRNQKLDYQNTVYVKTGPEQFSIWYQVGITVNGKVLSGYIRKGDALRRYYQFGKAEAAIRLVDEAVSSGSRVNGIANYRNANGRPPRYKGQTHDAYGTERSQSAPGYFRPDNTEEFVYLSDGTLVEYVNLDAERNLVEVVTVPYGKTYYVPARYLPRQNTLSAFTRAVIVDRLHQNEMAYEKIDGAWTLVSYSLCTTGTVSQYAQPTPLGYYFISERRPYFDYYKDGTNEIEGYAPYALRFNGSAYVHGVPMSYKIGSEGQRIHQGIADYSRSIGTIPLSHKCVRNYSSHAKFLYDWYVPTQTIVIVIE